MNSSRVNSVDIIIASKRNSFWDNIKAILKGYDPYKFQTIPSPDEVISKSDENLAPQLALVDGQDGTNPTNEWVQAIKMTYDRCRIIVLHTAENPIDFNLVKKNGADAVMHLSFDREFISDMILELAPVELAGEHIPISSLMPIDVRDIDSTVNINFDAFVHLPINHRSILIRKNGDFIEEKQIHKLLDSRQPIYIKKTQIKLFFEYARTIMSLRNAPLPLSFSEKFFRSKTTIYEIMSEFLNDSKTDYSEGKFIFEKCKGIIADFELTKDLDNEIVFSELARFCGSTRTIYHDCISLAASAAFFAQLIELPESLRESAALAGLLHNIGLSQLPADLVEKTPASMSQDEFSKYQNYPEKSVNLVKKKKIPLPNDVSVAIQEHREDVAGKGFPQKTTSDKQSELGRLLQIAYCFVESTSIQDNKNAFTVNEAISKLYEESLSGKKNLDLIILKKILDKRNQLK